MDSLSPEKLQIPSQMLRKSGKTSKHIGIDALSHYMLSIHHRSSYQIHRVTVQGSPSNPNERVHHKHLAAMFWNTITIASKWNYKHQHICLDRYKSGRTYKGRTA
eukprot:963413_1